VADFVANVGIPWPVGFSAESLDIARLGAFNETSPTMGYETKPLLMLIDPKGRLVWTDGHARFRHHDPEKTIRELDEAIGKAIRGEWKK